MDLITITPESKENIEYYSKNKEAFVSLISMGYKLNGNDENCPIGENGVKILVQACCTSLKLYDPGIELYQKLTLNGYDKLKVNEFVGKFLDECKMKL